MRSFTFISMLLFVFVVSKINAQTDSIFKPKATPFVRAFTNFHTTTEHEKTHAEFEMTRCYLGGVFEFTPNLSARTYVDIEKVKSTNGATDTLDYMARFQCAALTYKKAGLEVVFGLQPTRQFSVQEKFWEHRYVLKSFQDLYGFGYSSEFGALASYKVNDMVSADAAIYNGEGFKYRDADSSLKYCVGVTVNPIKELTVRAYADILPKAHDTIVVSKKKIKSDNQMTFGFFVGYKNEFFSIAAEYNQQQNNKLAKDYTIQGYSVYTTVPLCCKFDFFARYDKLWSNKLSGATTEWNKTNKDAGNSYGIVGGLGYEWAKNIRTSLNCQYKKYDLTREQTFVYLNFEYMFN